MLWFDHVLIAVADLDAAAERLRRDHGLASLPGGHHTGHGTANRIVPLGNSTYLELIAVVDPDEAAASAMGQRVSAAVAEGEGPTALSLRSDDVAAVAERLEVPIHPLRRVRPDGVGLQWRLAGLEAAMTAGLPFFVQCDFDLAHHPGNDEAGHSKQPGGISWAQLSGDIDRVQRWLGDHTLDIRPGSVGLRVGIATADGEIVL